MSRAMIFFAGDRPGDGPMIIALAGVLMINLTVLCVLIGVNEARSPVTQEVQPIAINTATTPTSRPQRRTSVGAIQTSPRVAAPQFTQTHESVDSTSADAPASTTQNVSPLAADVEDPAPQPRAQSKPAKEKSPLTFFGLPIE